MAGVELLLLLGATLSTVGDMKMTSLSVPSGSSLQLPTNCTFHPSNHYELRVRNQLIGSYSHDYLMPRLQFYKRLQFDRGICSFTLMNLTEENSDVYTFITKYDEKTRIQNQKEDFNITVRERFAPESPLNNSSQHHEDQIFGFLAVCFLLDPSVAAITMNIYRLILWLVKKCTKTFPRARLPCLHHISSLLLGESSQNVVNSGFECGEWFSLGCQFLGTVLLAVWKIYGHGHSVSWPICSAIGFFVESVIKCSSYLRACLHRCCPRYLMLFRPLLMSGLIVVVFSVMYHDITMTWNRWYLVAAMTSLMIRVVLILFYYWKQKDENEKTNKEAIPDPNALLERNENL